MLMKSTQGYIELFQRELKPWTGMSLDAKNKLAKIWQLKINGLSPTNYKDYFSVILFAEEYVREIRMFHYDMFDVELHEVDVEGEEMQNNFSFGCFDFPSFWTRVFEF